MISETLTNRTEHGRTELSVHITPRNELVLTLEGDEQHEFEFYKFESPEEVDWLINQLQDLKKEHFKTK